MSEEIIIDGFVGVHVPSYSEANIASNDHLHAVHRAVHVAPTLPEPVAQFLHVGCAVEYFIATVWYTPTFNGNVWSWKSADWRFVDFVWHRCAFHSINPRELFNQLNGQRFQESINAQG